MATSAPKSAAELLQAARLTAATAQAEVKRLEGEAAKEFDVHYKRLAGDTAVLLCGKYLASACPGLEVDLTNYWHSSTADLVARILAYAKVSGVTL